MTDALFVLDITVNLIGGCLSLFGNGLVIASFLKYQDIRTRTTTALVSLAVIDIILFPFSLLYMSVQLSHFMFIPTNINMDDKSIEFNDIYTQPQTIQPTTVPSNFSNISEAMSTKLKGNQGQFNRNIGNVKETFTVKNINANEIIILNRNHSDNTNENSKADENIHITTNTTGYVDYQGFYQWLVACKTIAGFSEFLAVCDLLNVLLIATERFIFIVYPLRYLTLTIDLIGWNSPMYLTFDLDLSLFSLSGGASI